MGFKRCCLDAQASVADINALTFMTMRLAAGDVSLYLLTCRSGVPGAADGAMGTLLTMSLAGGLHRKWAAAGAALDISIFVRL